MAKTRRFIAFEYWLMDSWESWERATHLKSGAIERTATVRQPCINVHRRTASCSACHPINEVLLRILPFKYEVGPRASMADAAGDEAAVLRASTTRSRSVDGLQLCKEVLAILQHTILLCVCGPIALELIAELP